METRALDEGLVYFPAGHVVHELPAVFQSQVAVAAVVALLQPPWRPRHQTASGLGGADRWERIGALFLEQ